MDITGEARSSISSHTLPDLISVSDMLRPWTASDVTTVVWKLRAPMLI